MALGATLRASGGVSSPDSPDSGPFADAFNPTDGRLYPDARPVPDFALQFVDPDHGPFTVGTVVTVRGIGFDDDTQVFFGGRSVEPASIQVVDSRRLIVTTPPGLPGAADVLVRKGDSVASLDDEFVYEAVVVEPAVGSNAGGTFITI